ncbi:cytochrome b/b6 domain-containing protein [bacterium]|nr:cytochrome b/b6 domain-containing protein [bacterium]MBU1883532.1 cytochrome b/b6 domain-containing protein [bacterium]
MNAEMFLKLAIIFLMSVFITMIALSALMMFDDEYAQNALIVHKSMGMIFLLVLPIHIYLRKHKLKKMISDLVMRFHEPIQECDNHKLLKTLKSRPFQEICDSVKISRDTAVLLLKEKNIIVDSVEDSLESIAQRSSYDALKIVAMILENQIRAMKNNQ